MVCHHLHPKSHWHPGAWSGMTEGRISLVVFHQINWLYRSFLFSYRDILPVYTKCTLRAVSTAKGQLADPVLCISIPYHRFRQANEQHQLKEKKWQRLWVVGFFFFSFPSSCGRKIKGKASQTDVLEMGRKLSLRPVWWKTSTSRYIIMEKLSSWAAPSRASQKLVMGKPQIPWRFRRAFRTSDTYHNPLSLQNSLYCGFLMLLYKAQRYEKYEKLRQKSGWTFLNYRKRSIWVLWEDCS